jgi:hypothetical protein
MIIIHGEPNGHKITFPPSPTSEQTAAIVERIKAIKSNCIGPASLTGTAESALDAIYKTHRGISDVRFESYSQRRLDHLIKLCIICAASRTSRSITERDVIYANTILSHTERFMPKALGEFGKAKNSDVAHKIYSFISANSNVSTIKQIWKQVSADLDDIKHLGTILNNLCEAGRIQRVPALGGFLPILQALSSGSEADKFIDWSLLSEEEREMKV